MVIAFTGHRPNKLGGYGDAGASMLLKFAIRVLSPYADPECADPIDHIITGMALGWDQAVAEAAYQLNIRFIAAIPCDNQDCMWPLPSKIRYKELLRAAYQVHLVSPGLYQPWKMQRRNEWMVDHANEVWALWDGSSSGTGNCVKYAKSINKPVRNLWNEWVAFQTKGE